MNYKTLHLLTKVIKELTRWNYDTLVRFVNNNQKETRLYFYKYLYEIVPTVFPFEYCLGKFSRYEKI